MLTGNKVTFLKEKFPHTIKAQSSVYKRFVFACLFLPPSFSSHLIILKLRNDQRERATTNLSLYLQEIGETNASNYENIHCFKARMSSSTLTGALGHVVFRFTRGRTEHYNPNKPGFTEKSFGYHPIESKLSAVQRYRSHQLGLSSLKESSYKGYKRMFARGK